MSRTRLLSQESDAACPQEWQRCAWIQRVRTKSAHQRVGSWISSWKSADPPASSHAPNLAISLYPTWKCTVQSPNNIYNKAIKQLAPAIAIVSFFSVPCSILENYRFAETLNRTFQINAWDQTTLTKVTFAALVPNCNNPSVFCERNNSQLVQVETPTASSHCLRTLFALELEFPYLRSGHLSRVT